MVKSHEAKPSAISPLYRKQVEYIPEFHDCPCYNINTTATQRGRYITFFTLVRLLERHSAMVLIYIYICYWASEASPTLGCSIEISRDICIYSIPHILTIVFPDTHNVEYLPVFHGKLFPKA